MEFIDFCPKPSTVYISVKVANLYLCDNYIFSFVTNM